MFKLAKLISNEGKFHITNFPSVLDVDTTLTSELPAGEASHKQEMHLSCFVLRTSLSALASWPRTVLLLNNSLALLALDPSVAAAAAVSSLSTWAVTAHPPLEFDQLTMVGLKSWPAPRSTLSVKNIRLVNGRSFKRTVCTAGSFAKSSLAKWTVLSWPMKSDY